LIIILLCKIKAPLLCGNVTTGCAVLQACERMSDDQPVKPVKSKVFLR